MRQRPTALDAAMFWGAKAMTYLADQLLLRIRARIARRRLRAIHGPGLLLEREFLEDGVAALRRRYPHAAG